jgi:hypothetical protein
VAVEAAGGVEVARGVAKEKPEVGAAGLAAAEVEEVDEAKEKAGFDGSSFFSFSAAGVPKEKEGTAGLGATASFFSSSTFFAGAPNERVGTVVAGVGAPILLRSDEDSFSPSFFSVIVEGAAAAAGAPKLKPAGTLNCIPFNTLSSRGGRSSSLAEKTLDDETCILDE